VTYWPVKPTRLGPSHGDQCNEYASARIEGSRTLPGKSSRLLCCGCLLSLRFVVHSINSACVTAWPFSCPQPRSRTSLSFFLTLSHTYPFLLVYTEAGPCFLLCLSLKINALLVSTLCQITFPPNLTSPVLSVVLKNNLYLIIQYDFPSRIRGFQPFGCHQCSHGYGHPASIQLWQRVDKWPHLLLPSFYRTVPLPEDLRERHYCRVCYECH
jgi:hypothetical protein